jgi:hypothetical protein
MKKSAGVWFGVTRTGAPVSFPVVFAGRDKKYVAEEISRRSEFHLHFVFVSIRKDLGIFARGKKELTHEIGLNVNLPIDSSGFLSYRYKNFDFYDKDLRSFDIFIFPAQAQLIFCH